MTPQELKNSILQRAIKGKLVEQRPEEGTGDELYRQIQAEKARLIKEGKLKKEKPLSPISEDEIPFDIPESWKWVRVNSLISLLSGCDLTPDKYNAKGKGVPYITGASNIDNNTLVINRWTEYPNNIAHKGDLLLTCKGTVGKMTILNEDAVHIARQIMALTSFCDTPFLRFFLETQINNLQKKARSMIPGIERDNVLLLCIPLPPLAEQKRVVAKIEELMPLVEQYGKAYNRLEQLNKQFPDDMKKSILQLAIQGKLVEQRPEEGTGEELYNQIQAEKAKLIKEGKLKKEKPLPPISEDEIPFDIPESWKWMRLNQIIQIESGQGLTANQMQKGNIPVYGGNGITGFHNQAIVDKDTIIIGRVGFYCGSVHVTETKAWVTDNAFITKYPTGSIDLKFLVFILRHMELGKNNNATAQPVVSGKKIYPLLFPLPPLAEQKRIVAKIEELLPLCDLLNRKWT